ncbi:MAG TPA: hypothetical protein VNT26_04185, partial [Candidatus Sulfotelmatobacter sp.]|nr:hypothetical protein [Candidatus Sulfotelmatobacter sp.]
APDPFNHSCLYLWDVQAARRVYTNTLFSTNRMLTSLSLQSIAITPDGQKLAYAFTCENTCYLFAAKLAPQTATQIETSTGPYSSLHLSADGRCLVCNRTASAASNKQVYLYDLQTATRALVSRRYDSLAEANGASDAPDLSPDGRFVLYHGTATDLVAGDTNGVPDIFLYDRQSGLNNLLSASRVGGAPNNRSLNPCFSPDGQTLAFQSWASDLMAGDFNHNGDVFAYTLLTLSMLPATSPGQGPWLCWPRVPGKSYRVQFKTSLADPAWRDVSGSISTQGTKAFLRDLAPAPTQKFYRVVAFE